MDVKTSTNEINIHLKINSLFKNDNQFAPIIYCYGKINTIPFINKTGKYNYMIAEYIHSSYELTDYITNNCKNTVNTKINPYYLSLQLFYYLAKIGLNGFNHCDIHTKNIMILKSKKTIELDFSNIKKSFKRVKVGKYLIKIIDFSFKA